LETVAKRILSCPDLLANVRDQLAAEMRSSPDFAVTEALPDVADDLSPCQAHCVRDWGGPHWPRSFKNGFKKLKIWYTSQKLFFQCAIVLCFTLSNTDSSSDSMEDEEDDDADKLHRPCQAIQKGQKVVVEVSGGYQWEGRQHEVAFRKELVMEVPANILVPLKLACAQLNQLSIH
jgi:hypothetical protein